MHVCKSRRRELSSDVIGLDSSGAEPSLEPHLPTCQVLEFNFFLPSCLSTDQQISQARPSQARLDLFHPAAFITTGIELAPFPLPAVFCGLAEAVQGRAKNGNKLDKVLTQLLSERLETMIG
ncbi:unnamed protein product [Pleuronectes platessa]|uniref:Uncharacterized protein n=1 Tax=Pleuronectes platessa TaxID=8262 RepID=A0A9N7UHE5_PLEPL|nr:unnamed protein product [Pleuronectes platessa]